MEKRRYFIHRETNLNLSKKTSVKKKEKMIKNKRKTGSRVINHFTFQIYFYSYFHFYSTTNPQLCLSFCERRKCIKNDSKMLKKKRLKSYNMFN